jgi:hypothetical protein
MFLVQNYNEVIPIRGTTSENHIKVQKQ